MKKTIATIILAFIATPLWAQEAESKPDRFMQFGYITLTGLTAADIDLSRKVMDSGGREVMPVYRKLGPGAFGFVNGAMNGAVGVAVYKIHKKQPKAGRWMMAGLLAAKGWVVWHNYREYKKR